MSVIIGVLIVSYIVMALTSNFGIMKFVFLPIIWRRRTAATYRSPLISLSFDVQDKTPRFCKENDLSCVKARLSLDFIVRLQQIIYMLHVTLDLAVLVVCEDNM